MGEVAGEFDTSLMAENMERLAANPYPGRLIVMGVTPDSEAAVQVYAVMGRSPDSRNRVLVGDGEDIVKTDAIDWSIVKDPSLIIYNAMRRGWHYNNRRIDLLSNGDQTDTLHFSIVYPKAAPDLNNVFMRALLERDFEPDGPNFTPRISGMIALKGTDTAAEDAYNYSIIRRNPTTGRSEYTFGGGELDEIPGGSGICFHTYQGNGDPLPPFEGSPYAVPIESTAEENAEAFWDVLDPENRVAIVAKTIDRSTGEVALKIINALESTTLS